MKSEEDPKRNGYIRDIHLRDCTVARVLMRSVSCNDNGVPARSSIRRRKRTIDR